MPEDTPLIQLSETGTPSVLDYNIPEPTSFTGRNLIKLPIDETWLKDVTGSLSAPEPAPTDSDDSKYDQIEHWFIESVLTNPWLPAPEDEVIPEIDIDDPKISDEILDEEDPIPPGGGGPRRRRRGGRGGIGRASFQLPKGSSPQRAASTRSLTSSLSLGKQETIAHFNAGKVPTLVKSQSGEMSIDYATHPESVAPGLFLVETYRLSNHLGDYGAGRTVKTFSLLPGEKTKISISTWKTESSTESSTRTIFDSVTSETVDDFESTVQSENTDNESKENTTAWSVEAEATGSWGVASASVSGSASGETNSARETFASNVAAATEKHSETASAQRNMEVNTATETVVETGEETAIEREIQNINVGRTLNFVFRQLNQEFISILHLVDVQVGYFNGYEDTKMIVPLNDLDRLFDYCLTASADREEVRGDIHFLLENIHDINADARNLLAEREYAERDGSTTKKKVVDRSVKSVYQPEGANIPVQGIILSANQLVVRTDALIVEALLGQATALDKYSGGLQDEKVREKGIANDLAEAEAAAAQLKLDIVDRKDTVAAGLFAQLFPSTSAEATEDVS